jgi:[histone H3]-dimethyl-L-lysine9 demethylase
MTSLFCCTWMCRKCGREACAECFEKVKELTDEPSGGVSEQLKQKRDRQQNMNPFFLTCQKREDHTVADFNPVSRFNQGELEDAIKGMEAVLAKPEPAMNGSAVPIPEAPLKRDDPSGIPYFEVPTFRKEDLTDDVFTSLWPRGEPIRVTGIKFRLSWTPQYFVENYGDQSCVVSECQRDQNKSTNVQEFFSGFGKYAGRDGCWKLKDWPPKAELKTVFPELFDDFNDAVPMPNYVRRNGTLNLSSHFPQNTISPDLGK